MHEAQIQTLTQLVADRPDLAERLQAVRGRQGQKTTAFARPLLPCTVEKALVDCGALGRRERDDTHLVQIRDPELDRVLAAAGPVRDVDAEIRRLIPPLDAQTRAGLEESLRREGLRDPLVRWAGHDVWLDGRNRLEICRKHGIPLKVVDVELADEDAAVLWAVENQLHRRNLTDDQRTGLAAVRLAMLKREGNRKHAARAAAVRHGTACPEVETTSGQTPPAPRLREKVAREAGVSEHALRSAVTVAKVDPTILQEVVAGRKTLRQARQAIQQKDRRVQSKSEAVEPAEEATSWQPPAIALTEDEERVLKHLRDLAARINGLYAKTDADRHLSPSLESLVVKLVLMAGGLRDGDDLPEGLQQLLDIAAAARAMAADLDRALHRADVAFAVATGTARPPKGWRQDPRFQQMLTWIQQDLADTEPPATV